MDPILDGIDPINLLKDNGKELNFASCPIFDGIDPINLLEFISREINFDSCPI